ncbi:PadR family transcriptional regulator [Paenibacillus sedimenti]|uniref:PadR family transcriptional regulator n=1 Tax=Paenibacillus sedimenti TaxID=2770274 RepID=A0A926KTZ8_9BACL|nr:PadR family transcriptional regulator [Paenibacillus sedimenti]MBD0384000.1 PadR family transcriptional regulator [Paenibacillus sedimenti]
MKAQDVILGILMDGTKSGYDIKKDFETVFSYFYDASFGSVYPALKVMEKEELIVKETVIQEGKPNKHVYAVTDKGREAFHAYLRSPVTEDIVRSDISTRLFFGQHAEPDLVSSWITDVIREYEESLRIIEQFEQEQGDRMTVTQKICLSLGINSHRNEIETLKAGLVMLREHQDNLRSHGEE